MFVAMASDPYFVDKSWLISELIPSLGREKRFFCITRPRRFGKSIMANMVGAFFGKATDGRQVFGNLKIAELKNYQNYLNQYNVVYIDFSEMPEKCTSYDEYITRFLKGLRSDLQQAYQKIPVESELAVWDILTDIFQKTGEKFVFVIDEWDAIFHMPFINVEQQKEFLLFLKSLLKGKVYLELVYMTGVLPITSCLTSFGTQESDDSFVGASGESLPAVFPADAPYSSGSELNMFLEYDMSTKKKFSEYFGFLDEEVDRLFEIYQAESDNPEISREDLRIWYDGYHTASGKRIYNPRSIASALGDNELADYWTSSGPYDEIFYYIRNNMNDVREDIVLMVAGEGVKAEIQNYAAVSMGLKTKDEIYSAMVVYGLLTYENGKVFIPNREIMKQFQKLLMSKDSLGYVYNLARESEKMLEATLSEDTQTMVEILKFAHDTEAPIFSYNSEIELSAIVNLVYLAARDRYRIEREDKAGEGYVDFIFYPESPNSDAIILELKIDSTPQKAIKQIKDKNYALRFRGKLGEKPKYTGRILAVGISYSRKTKKHSCKIELL